jgi:hypothetical protein
MGGECGRQHGEGGYAVEEDRDTEPKEGHRRVRATLQYIRRRSGCWLGFSADHL